VAQIYANQKTMFNNVDRNVPWLSPARTFQAWMANPAFFTMTPAQLVTKYKNSVGGRQALTDKGLFLGSPAMATPFLLATRRRFLTPASILKGRSRLPSLILLSILAGLQLANTEPALGQGIKADSEWVLTYDGKASPLEQGWTPVGELAANARMDGGALRMIDDSSEKMGAFRMGWTPDPSKEVVVEARVRVEAITAPKGTKIEGQWPSRGWPGCLIVSDGKHQGGLVLRPDRISTFFDRVAMMDARSDFHTYKLVIRGKDLSIYVDGERKIIGEGAFWKPADSPEAFIQFGSNSPSLMGETHWSSVKLGIRKVQEKTQPPRLRITISEPWVIPALPPGNPYIRPFDNIRPNSRPYLYDLGRGLLLMSVAQGNDAVIEPYGVLKSTDEGKTWAPVRDMQYKMFVPLPMIRLPDNNILGISRENVSYDREKGVFVGMTFRFDEATQTFTMGENLIRVPDEKMVLIVFDRDIFTLGNGEMLASVYGYGGSGHRAMLLKSTDKGLTWNHFSTLGARDEPSVVRFSETEMMAVLRVRHFKPMEQIWSNDGGKTWSPPVIMEEGSVAPDMTYMSNGVLACSYGRPGSHLMFSLDKGKTWGYHQVISDKNGFNYTAIREVRPGRLLYVHDAPSLQALYVDVERLE
jgi:photosystem II stability/assembly factor-like uncharacterized protein